MQSRTLGNSGVSISRVGLGGFELGPQPGDEPDVVRGVGVIEAALAAGINWLDTSENYLETNNESLIGAALARVSGEFAVATKVAPEAGITGGASGFRHSEVHAACRASLRRLGRDHIDMYFLHWPDESGVPLEETWGAMAELADQGLVRAIGLSNYEMEDIERCNRQRAVDVVQDGLSLIDFLEARAQFARCGELGIAVTVYDVLAGGVLSDKTQEQVLAIYAGTWEESGFYQALLVPGRIERSFAVADGLRPIAERLDATVAQVAIAWVLHQSGVTSALAGSWSGRHVGENAQAESLDISGELDAIEQLIPLGPSFA